MCLAFPVSYAINTLRHKGLISTARMFAKGMPPLPGTESCKAWLIICSDISGTPIPDQSVNKLMPTEMFLTKLSNNCLSPKTRM